MRIWSLAAAVVIVMLTQVSSAFSENKKAILEGAQNFCSAKYGKRLLGVSVKGANEFSCRFAAVERTETYKIAVKSKAPPKQAAPKAPAPTVAAAKPAKPKWDLDEGEEPGAASSSSLPDTAIALPSHQPGLQPAPDLKSAAVAKSPRKWRKRKWRKRNWRKRRWRNRRAKRRRHRARRNDPFAQLFGQIGKKRVKKRRRTVRRRYRKRRRARY